MLRIRNLHEVKVKDIMTRDAKSVTPGVTVSDAAIILSDFRIDSLIIVSDDRPIGIITGRDIIDKVVRKAVHPSRVKVGEIMSAPVVTVSPEESVDKAVSLMVENDIKKLPVVKGERVVGILTTADIVRHYPLVADEVKSLKEEKARKHAFWEWYRRK